MARRKARRNPVGMDDLMLALAGAAALGAGVYVIAKPSAAAAAAPTAPPGPVQTVIVTPAGGFPASILTQAGADFGSLSPTAADISVISQITTSASPAAVWAAIQASNPTVAAQLAGGTGAYQSKFASSGNSTVTYQPPASDPTGAWAVAHAFQLLVAANPITSATTPTPPTGTGRPGTMLIGGPRGGFAGVPARAAAPVRRSGLGRAGLGW